MPWQPLLALHTWTLDTTPLAQVLEIARTTGWSAIELRQPDFDRAASEGRRADELIASVRASGLPVCMLGTRSGFLFAPADERRELLKALQDTCRHAVALGCPMLMTGPGRHDAPLAEAAAVLREAGDIVAAHGLRMAVEFSWMHGTLHGVPELVQLLDLAGHPACGALLDTYHLQRSGRPGRGFDEVPAERLFAVQFSDCTSRPDPAHPPPTDRLLPGTGDVQWREVFEALADLGYSGALSFEAPNPSTWSRDPREVAVEALAATHRLLATIR